MLKSLTINKCDGVTAPDPWTPRPLSSVALPGPPAIRRFLGFIEKFSGVYPGGSRERLRLKGENSG